ncbi:SapC family protein [Rhodospirillum centenum]|uniref:SapC family protein n=1 Tax=Rhodospirillum centenum (strain ATCC 51521 / SW) TaxID=414684 RepID=B6ITF2_RHOCS|nr:SapC family protein [Rhodospirillum centenum]ACI99170.1 SapC family protein [Rhodospirillum centenum SW]
MSEATGAPAGMPLFYKAPVPVAIERHKDWKVKQRRSFAYASGTNAIPVVLEEFPVLQGHYPLVFTNGEQPSVVALVGLRPQENLYLEDDGTWKRGKPIPAYVRRYPFILMETPDRERLILCIEEDKGVVGPDGEFALFDGDQPAAAGQDALNFCGTFNQSAFQTQAFCQELKSRGLLTEQRADMVTPENKRISLSGFCVVDEKKFNELPDEVFLEWRKRNWIGLVYAHLMSLGHWNELVEATARRTAAA